MQFAQKDYSADFIGAQARRERRRSSKRIGRKATLAFAPKVGRNSHTCLTKLG